MYNMDKEKSNPAMRTKKISMDPTVTISPTRMLKKKKKKTMEDLMDKGILKGLKNFRGM